MYIIFLVTINLFDVANSAQHLNEKEENSSPKMAANYSPLCVKRPNPRNNPAGNYTKLT